MPSGVYKRKPFTEEHKRNMRKAMMGKHVGEKHPMWGKKRSRETGRKISKALKGKPRLQVRGERHYCWKGGITKINERIRKANKYVEWRQQIFLRDNFTCQECGVRGGYLHVHHNKKSFKQLLEEVRENLPLFDLYEGAMIYSPLWDLNNGVTLCKECHKIGMEGR